MFLYNTSIINKHRYCKLKREFIKNQIMKETQKIKYEKLMDLLYRKREQRE